MITAHIRILAEMFIRENDQIRTLQQSIEIRQAVLSFINDNDNANELAHLRRMIDAEMAMSEGQFDDDNSNSLQAFLHNSIEERLETGREDQNNSVDTANGNARSPTQVLVSDVAGMLEDILEGTRDLAVRVTRAVDERVWLNPFAILTVGIWVLFAMRMFSVDFLELAYCMYLVFIYYMYFVFSLFFIILYVVIHVH